MRRHAYAVSLAVVAALCACASACGGKVVLDHGGVAGSGASSTGTGGACGSVGGSAPGGDCTIDADCDGGTCAPITSGGYLVCLDGPPESTSCMQPVNGMNQCCTSADCTQGKCYSTHSFPSCGGPASPLYNACVDDRCTTDADCVSGAGAPQACIPAGAYREPVRTCLTAYCHTDADCTAHPCGRCAPVIGPCCSTPAGLGCVYPGGCRRNAECGDGSTCNLDPETGTGVCKPITGGVCPN